MRRVIIASILAALAAAQSAPAAALTQAAPATRRRDLVNQLLCSLAAVLLAATAARGDTYATELGAITQMTVFPSYVRISATVTHPVQGCGANGFILESAAENYDAYLAVLIAAQHAGKQVRFIVETVCVGNDGARIVIVYVNT